MEKSAIESADRRHAAPAGCALEQWVYVSRSRLPDPALVKPLLATCRRNNRRLDVTGCLVYTGEHFAQVLEGQPQTVQELVRRIETDERHQDCMVLTRRGLTIRQYPNWSMGYVFRADVSDRVRDLARCRQVSLDELDAILELIQPDSVMGEL